MTTSLTRRRVIGITAAAAGLSLVPIGRAARAQTALVTWQGHAMGAVASLQLHHPDREAAERLIERAIAEARRLEAIFSLYREDSALATLNRTGILVAPPPELVELMRACQGFSELTSGAFDPTVQPLWMLYFNHFSKPGADRSGPPRAAVEATLAHVGMHKVLVGPDRIAFARRGMGVTLNGIAQGFLTDRVVELLRSEGFDHCLVDLGESRALGKRGDGEPWRIALQGSDGGASVDEILPVIDRAVATSGAYGFRFDPEGRFHHLFDPATGTCAALYRSVTVVTQTATTADALSTAFSLMTSEAIAKALEAVGGGEVHLTTGAGERMVVTT